MFLPRIDVRNEDGEGITKKKLDWSRLLSYVELVRWVEVRITQLNVFIDEWITKQLKNENAESNGDCHSYWFCRGVMI